MSTHRIMLKARLAIALAAGLLGLLAAHAAEHTYDLGGLPMRLREAGAEAEVFYSAMRYNRALNVWNVEVTIRNKGATPLAAPIVLQITAMNGIPGVSGADGNGPGGLPYFDCTANAPNGLAPGASTTPKTLTLHRGGATPSITASVWCAFERVLTAGFAQTLDGTGVPMGGVEVLETQAGSSREFVSDGEYGLASLGDGAGDYLWQFSREGYYSSWRQGSIVEGRVTLIPSPRLVKRATADQPITTLNGGTVSVPGKGIEIVVPPGAVQQNASSGVTPLDGQNLPGVLPLGWSPLQAFWVEFTGNLEAAAEAKLELWDVLGNEQAAFARWNEATRQWQVLGSIQGDGSVRATVSIMSGGAYVVAVPDTGAFGPPAATVGLPLASASGALPVLSGLTAQGEVRPASRPASLNPELVTGIAEVIIENPSGPAPSGVVLPSDIFERYELRSGVTRPSPRYRAQTIFYQRPGDNNPNTLHARFPVRPTLLFGGDELVEGKVTVEVLSEEGLNGRMIGPEGGTVEQEGLRIRIGAGAVGKVVPVEIWPTSAEPFAHFNNGEVETVRSFELLITDVAPGARIVVEADDLEANTHYVLARAHGRAGFYGLDPAQRLMTDAQGRLQSMEPGSGLSLRGIAGPGLYVLLKVKSEHGLLHGVARNSAGEASGGIAVQVHLQPWLVFSEANGQYRMIAPVGAAEIVATNPTDQDQGSASPNVGSGAQELDLSTAQTGPRVVSITPAGGATGVARVSSIVVRFSEPVNAAAVLPANVQLIAGTNGPAAFTLSLNLQQTVLTILPVNQLPADAEITVRLLPAIQDGSGFGLEGPSEFKFQTETALLNRVAGQVVIYEPEQGDAAITGTAGTAEPGGVVILVNETTGYTATVLAAVDGSFTNSIPADVEDFLSAVVVNNNGSRTQIPASRQIFKDGSVGLYNQGGFLEAESDGSAVEVFIEPGAIPTKTKFKMAPVSVAQVLAAMGGAEPIGGQALKGMKMSVEGDEIPEGGKVSFDVELEELGLPEGTEPEDAVFALAAATKVNGVPVYQVVDKMTYKNGKLTTASPPFTGIMGFFANNPGEALLSALKVALGKEAAVHGRVYSQIPGNEASRRPLPGAVAFVAPSPSTPLVDENRRLKNGAIVAVADELGEFALVISLPFLNGEFAGDGFPVLAISTLFPDQIISRPAVIPPEAVSPIAAVNMVFDRNTGGTTLGFEDNTPPTLSIAHGPVYGATNEPVVLRVLANDNGEMQNVLVDVVSANPIVEGIQPSIADVTLSGPLNLVNRGQNLSQEHTVTVTKPAQVQFYIQAYDKAGNGSSAVYSIEVGGELPPAVPVPNPNDHSGPFVTASTPSAGSIGFAPHKPIVLRFNEEMDSGSLSNYNAAFSFNPPVAISVARLTPDFQGIELQCADLEPNKQYTLTANATLRDLNGNPLDQNPYNTITNESFVMTFKTAPLEAAAIPNIQFGGGVVANGRTLYILERTGVEDGALVVVDATDPQNHTVVKRLPIGEYPRDLVFIPNYAYKLQDPGLGQTNDLLAIVGGRVGGEGQYLDVYNVSNPAQPERVAFAWATQSPTAAITKVAWSAPHLAYLESDADVTAVAYVNLQLFLYSDNLSGDEFAQEPLVGDPGKDTNGDGDFADFEDEIPRPRGGIARVGLFNNGLVRSFSLEDYSTQRIEDFSIAFGGNFLAAVTSPGQLLGPNGSPGAAVGSQFLPLVSGGAVFNPGSVSADLLQRSKRVSCFFGVPFLDGARTNLLNLAFVTGTDSIVVLNITDIQSPTNFAVVPIRPVHGAPQSVTRRSDGLFQIATFNDILLLDAALLLENPPAQQNGAHPSLVGMIPGMGSGVRSFVGASDGFYAVAGGGKVLVFGGPNRVDLVAHRPGSIFTPGAALTEAVEENPLQLIVSVNRDYDEATEQPIGVNLLPNTKKDFDRVKPLFEENDLIKLELKRLPVPTEGQNPQTVELIFNFPAAEAQTVRIYNATGHELQGVNYSDPANITITSSYTSEFDLLSGLAGEDKVFYIEAGQPTHNASIEYKLIDADGTIIGSDTIKFSAVKYEITAIWSEQFPGVRANRLPGQAGNGNYAGGNRPNNFLLLAAEPGGDIKIGAELQVLPDIPQLKSRVQVALMRMPSGLITALTDFENAFVMSGGSSVQADGTYLVRSPDDRPVFILPMSFQYYMEYFVGAGIDYNIDGEINPAEVNQIFGGARVNSSGLPRVLYSTTDTVADKLSKYHLIEQGHIKVVNQSLFLNSYGIMNGFLSAIIAGVGFFDDNEFPNLSVAHLLAFLSSTAPVINSPSVGPNPVIASTAEVSAYRLQNNTRFEQAHNTGEFSGDIRTIPKYTYTTDSLIPQKVRGSGRFRLMMERILLFQSNRNLAHGFFSANPETQEHVFEFTNTGVAGTFYDNFVGNCLNIIQYDWLNPSPQQLATIFTDSFHGCNDFDLAFGIGGFSVRPHLKTRARVRCEGLPYTTNSVLRVVEMEVLEGSMEDIYDWDFGVDTYMAIVQAGYPHYLGFTGLTPGRPFVFSIPLAGKVENFQAVIPAPTPAP